LAAAATATAVMPHRTRSARFIGMVDFAEREWPQEDSL
jgi:hypothetical protein